METEDIAAEAYAAQLVKPGYYTVVWPDGEHRTFKVSGWKRDKLIIREMVRWLSLLIGPANEADYETVGLQRDTGEVVIFPRYRDREYVVGGIDTVLHGSDEDRAAGREAYAMASGRCAICNRVLTVPASIHRGIGPECAKKM